MFWHFHYTTHGIEVSFFYAKSRTCSFIDVKVLDTTGAGDAFNGGLLAGLSQGMELLSAARYGNVVSNLAVTKLGTAPAMPTKQEIDVFIEKEQIKF